MDKIKHIVFNGCSFVQGCQDNPEHSKFQDTARFSKLLVDKLGVQEINLAMGGSSNDRILRTTYDWILENEDKVSSTLFIIGLTQVERTELLITDKWIRVFSLSSLTNEDLEHIKNNDISLNDFKAWAKFKMYDSQLKKDISRKLDLLQTYIKSKKSNVVFFKTFDEYYISDKINVWKPNGNTTWAKYISSYDKEYVLTHPTLVDHKKLFELLYKDFFNG